MNFAATYICWPMANSCQNSETHLQNFMPLHYTDLQIMLNMAWNYYFAQVRLLDKMHYILFFKYKQINKFHNIDMNITITHFVCLPPTKAMWWLFVVYLWFDQQHMHALARCMEVLQVRPYLWQDSEFAFECAMCIILHLIDNDKLYASESPQER